MLTTSLILAAAGAVGAGAAAGAVTQINSILKGGDLSQQLDNITRLLKGEDITKPPTTPPTDGK